MTAKKIRRQYGLWDSPINPQSLAQGMTFANVAWDRDGTLVWLEGRSGRSVLVCLPPDGQALRDLNSVLDVRARVGYGGGDFTVGEGSAYFVDASSGRLYHQPLAEGTAQPVTPAFGRFASPALSPDGRWLLFVHTYEEIDRLGIVDARGEFWPGWLVSGEDFFMQPAWHPDSERIAWICWNHPNMPWDGTSLSLGKLAARDGGLPFLIETSHVAGDEKTSILQPEFSPDGRTLAYVSDATGWWQLYLYDLESGKHRQVTQVQAEHGAPAWVQGMRTYGFSPEGKSIYFIRNQDGDNTLWQVELDSGKETRLPLEETYTALDQVAVAPSGGQIALLASGGRQPPRVISFQLTGGVQIARRGTSEELGQEFYSASQAIEWQGLDGGTVHGLYYPPHNPGFEGVGKPPLVINIHGGPTSQALKGFSPRAQFFTSRGYAYLEVNYRGSTGYGRAYRDLLRGNWGIYDVQDAVSGGRALAGQGRVDPDKIVIMGGSAGGYTVLQALVDYPGIFKAGICLYGISNQFTAATDTHKFEARYSDSLLGPLPEAAAVYRERSPLFSADKIQDPVAFFHGEEDAAVPRSQSDEMAASLKRRGVAHVYHLYPGEGHGFRKAETIEHLYRTIEQFLKQYVIFA
jgi:dipeptidyl aminopeptidase/acylaminoacyl peptidase